MNTYGLPKQTIKFEGIFDYNKFLKFIVGWFHKRKWKIAKEKIKHKVPNAMGAEEEFEYKFSIKESDYIKSEIVVWFKMFELRKVEVVKKGKKKQLRHGRLLIELEGKITTDYQGKFKGSFFKQKLGNFYDNFILYKEIGGLWWDKLHYNIIKLNQDIKKNLEMESTSDAYDDMW